MSDEPREILKGVHGNALGVASRIASMALSDRFSRDTCAELARILRWCAEEMDKINEPR